MKIKEISLDNYENVYVTSDIHGSIELLDKLLDRVQLTSKDLLLILGDSCDRGPATKKVYDRILDLQEKYSVIHIMGNHERMLLDAMDNKENYWLWMQNGGGKTLASYVGEKVSSRHLQWIQRLPYGIETDGYYLVHAGIDPLNASLKKQSPQTLLWTRMLMQSVDLATDKTVIFGHNITPNGKILEVSSQQIAIDCGSYVYHRLGCLEIKTMEKIYVE